MILYEEITPVVICSDFRNVLFVSMNFNHLKTKNFFIHKIRNLLFHAENKNIKISLFWMPGHKGIFGNEVADKLAELALTNGTA